MIQVAGSTLLMECEAFNRARRALLTSEDARVANRSLSSWAMPTDRGLPLVFLDRSLKSLLRTPFEELAATPGVGPKKISRMIDLLQRAVQAKEHLSAPTEAALLRQNYMASTEKFDDELPIRPTKAVWDDWRAAVLEHGLADYTLGQFISTLERLPRPLWNAPLRKYAELDLRAVYRLRGHGRKRFEAVFEIFGDLFARTSSAGRLCNLRVTIEPALTARLDAWARRWQEPTRGVPDESEVLREFIHPLLNQLHIDGGTRLAYMAAAKMEASMPAIAATQETHEPAGPYSWYYRDKVTAIVHARWPQGYSLASDLIEVVQRRDASTPSVDLLERAIRHAIGARPNPSG